MSAPPADPATRLGHEVVSRLRLPGPAGGHGRPSRIGSVATASTRFAGSILRSVAMRSALEGPAPARVNSYRDAGLAPPRWWSPEFPMMIEQRRQAARAVVGDLQQRPVSDLPSRSLPRAVRRVPDEQTWTPGGIVETLVSEPLPVRRLDATAAAGPMLMQHDRAKLNASQALIFRRKTAPAKTPEFRSYSGRKPPPPPPSVRRSGRGAGGSGGSGGSGAGGGTGGGGGTFTTPRPGSGQRPPTGSLPSGSSPGQSSGPGGQLPAPRATPGGGSRPTGPTARAPGTGTGPSWMPLRLLRFPAAATAAAMAGLDATDADGRPTGHGSRPGTALALADRADAGQGGGTSADLFLDGVDGGDGGGATAMPLRSAFRSAVRRTGMVPHRPLYRSAASAGQLVGPLRRVVGGPHAVHPRLRIADATPGMRMLPRRPADGGDAPQPGRPGRGAQPGSARPGGRDAGTDRRPDAAQVRAFRAARMRAATTWDADEAIARTPLDDGSGAGASTAEAGAGTAAAASTAEAGAGTAAASAGSAGSGESATGAASGESVASGEQDVLRRYGAAATTRTAAGAAATGGTGTAAGTAVGTGADGAADGWSDSWAGGEAAWVDAATYRTAGTQAGGAHPAYRGYRGGGFRGRGLGGAHRGVGFASFTLLRSSAQPSTTINPRTAAHRLPALGAIGAAGLLGLHLGTASAYGATAGDQGYAGSRRVGGRTALVPQGGGSAAALRRSTSTSLDAAVLLQAIQSVSLPAGTSLDPVVLRRSIQAAGVPAGAALDPVVLRRALQAAAVPGGSAVPGSSAVDPVVLRRAIESAALPSAAALDATVLRRAIQAAGVPAGASLDVTVLRRAIQSAGITGSAVGAPAALAAAIAQTVRAGSAAGGGTSMSMPDLLVTQRGPSHGALSTRGTSLATGFGSAELIRPAGGRGGAAALAPPMGSPGVFGAGREGPVPSLRRRLAAEATGRAAGGGGMRGYLPAPPPVSFRPPGAAGGPPAPGGIRRSAAASTAAAAVTAMTTAGGADLVARTAHLFADTPAGMPDNVDIRRWRSPARAGVTMTSSTSGPALRVVPTSPLSTATDGDADPLEILDDPQNLDRLVDKVVGRIERRVIDELERRGRRHRPGVF